MFLANHPELLPYLILGFDRLLRLYRAARRVDRERGPEIIDKKIGLIWNPSGNESLIDYRRRIDKIINQIFGEKRSRPISSKKLISDFQKWGEFGKELMEKIISDGTVPGRLDISDLKAIEESLGRLREAIEQAG